MMFQLALVETRRLRLRLWQEADFPDFAAMNADPEVMRHFPATLSEDESRVFFERILAEIRTRGYGPYALERKEDGRWLGFVGLHWADFEAFFTPCVEILWRMKRDAWGQGYASEAAAACLRYARNELGIDEVWSFTALPNSRSRRVMERIGMEPTGEFDHPALPIEHPLARHVAFRTPLQTKLRP